MRRGTAAGGGARCLEGVPALCWLGVLIFAAAVYAVSGVKFPEDFRSYAVGDTPAVRAECEYARFLTVDRSVSVRLTTSKKGCGRRAVSLGASGGVVATSCGFWTRAEDVSVARCVQAAGLGPAGYAEPWQVR